MDTKLLQWPIEGVEGYTALDAHIKKHGYAVVLDMPNDLYHGHQSISSSGLRTINQKSPAHYYVSSPWNPDRKPQEKKRHFSLGNAAHDLLLQRDKFFDFNFVLPSDFNPYKKEGKELKKGKEEEGFNVIKHEEFNDTKEMVKAVDAHPFAGAAFSDGLAEVSIFWVDEELSEPEEDFYVIKRCRPDFLPNDIENIPDYKTTACAHPDSIKKSIGNFGYHMQHAWYMDAIRHVFKKEPKRFFFVFQEKEPPYAITPSLIDAEAIHYGSKLNQKALEVYARCLKTGNWPAYTENVVVSTLPTYELMRLDQMEQDGEL